MPQSVSSVPSAVPLDDVVTHHLLGQRLQFLQPRRGYRVAIDAVLAAAAVEPAWYAAPRILDVGAGGGAISLCVRQRLGAASAVYGLEIQPEMAALWQQNFHLNGFMGHVAVGSIAASPFQQEYFDVVVSNPPYEADGSAPPSRHKALCHMEQGSGVDLKEWITQMLRMLRGKGRFVMVHRADRLPDILAALQGRAGDIAVVPFWPKAGRPAKRVVVIARKGMRAPAQMLPGVCLHTADGCYTSAATQILTQAASLQAAGAYTQEMREPC
jgi:tRNA1(Val) A37 N6-methylase TrmN6